MHTYSAAASIVALIYIPSPPFVILADSMEKARHAIKDMAILYSLASVLTKGTMWFYNYSIALLVILVSVVSAASSNLPVVNNDRTYATTTTRTVTSHSTIIPPPLSTTHIYMTTVVHEGNYNETLVASFAVSGTALPATLPSYMSSYFLSVL